ncbi:uncharacterized protein LOC106178596 [Lingula anatina]|uniref:Uncharacterized protein LOC106178596 n=1 Tax=Lingula anatina TaxID=7574 RepID=A0A1S3K3U7_LINAN|nr:uncharacterized protein LOC106178596 [Lingula anatina]|eukprot:XP_013417300.1 uncharacterized protein LOC106178596 [Lingula anatina]
MGNTLLNPCSTTAAAVSGQILACDNGLTTQQGACTFNPFFLLFTTSAQACLCPAGYYLTYNLTASPDIDVDCTSISGTPCRSDLDCNSRASDCLGISSFSQVNFDGSGTTSTVSQDIVDFLLPAVSLICSFNDIYLVSRIPVYFCDGAANAIGRCESIESGPYQTPPIDVPFYQNITLTQGVIRDLNRRLLFTRYPVTYNPSDPLTFSSVNVLSGLIP